MVTGLLALTSGHARAQETDPSTLGIARDWLRVVAGGHAPALARSTSIPFVFATTAKVKRRERKVGTSRDLSSWLACLHKSHKLLIEEVRQNEAKPSDPASVPSKALKALAARSQQKGRGSRHTLTGTA